MNETPKIKSGRRIPRVLLIWLALFITIVLVMTVVGFVTHIPKRPPYPLMVLIFSVVGASLCFPFVGLVLFIRWLNCWRNVRRALVGLAILATLVAIFYTEEDWRGKRDWENCKRELEAKGETLNWNAYTPPPVPDDQNFFMASTNIFLRFVKQQNQAQMDAAAHLQWLRLISYFTSDSNSFPILDFAKSNQPVVAEISFVSVKNDSAINLDDLAAQGKIQDLIRSALGRSVNGAQGFRFCELPLDHLSPVKIDVRSSKSVSVGDLENVIPSDLATNIGRLGVEATSDPKIFHVKLVSGNITPAADYLKWSDQFVPAFDEVRAALKRPYAIIPGDYSLPYQMPIPNFVTMRALAQTLAQRAQCDFLLNQPDEALHELTLIHDVCRILEKPPTGKPETLVEAMINVAITGLYVSIVQDGLRLHVWQEPQLQAIQSQMENTRLLPFVTEAFRMEQVSIIQFATKQNVKKYLNKELFIGFGVKVNFWDKVKGQFSILIPQGWIYQNLRFAVQLEQKQIDCLDSANEQVFPSRLNKANSEIDHAFSHYSPYQYIASIAIPNTVKAMQTAAHNQTMVNEAQIVCALERYRLAHGEYPETLDALAPQFIETVPHDIIGGQPLNYRPTDDGKFLLYSVGWNETDDGGQEVSPQTKNGGMDYTKGDWVWKN